ncbi:S-adenosyl-L-methionine-dependent methyltransferase [Actinoplanes ianthinogenes]|uniref:S-adenosyl-L-methionine-dependent methyltransferase n=1 Tax=Actinoplanes ianthinogenes TaxID=122358 RepID=A0ABN6CRG2_9ACTN|nr:SAM-dependent methyltransferase [Actinoplanes ianthinogenes]BCJ47815.1 S-adenosyl-L-methionine-dependent methyltransferase [Actinoplanes ianthinogenes]GGR04351.1 S-adenosyl-L-methionine-dependent methyltransferase [Actinoplanes ianthinogenes]
MVAFPVPEGVGRTALGMARVRAEESGRPDRLFDDPYAQAFVAAAGDALPGGAVGGSEDPMAAVVHAAVVRTRYFDDFLMDACASGCRQVVVLAAGLDTRAFRLPWPAGVSLFEADLPAVLAFKEQVLTGAGAVPRCHRVTVPADLRDDWRPRLITAGFRPAEPAAWLIEGLLIYLTVDQATALLETVTELSAADSRLACERSGRRQRPPEAAMPRLAPFTEMWKGGLGPALPRWLAGHGWQVRVDDRDRIADAYGRPSPIASDGGYLTSVRTA